MIEIELSWPGKWLNPNKFHRYATNRERQEQREEAFYMARSYSFDEWDIPEEIAVTYTFYPPTAHKRDDDNLIEMMKGARDGIADAFRIDDNRMHTQPIEWGDVFYIPKNVPQRTRKM